MFLQDLVFARLPPTPKHTHQSHLIYFHILSHAAAWLTFFSLAVSCSLLSWGLCTCLKYSSFSSYEVHAYTSFKPHLKYEFHRENFP